MSFWLKKNISLEFIWSIRCRLRTAGDKLWAEGSIRRAEADKRMAEADKRMTEAEKRMTESEKLLTESEKLWAEGDKIWAEAIIAFYGNIKMEWKKSGDDNDDYECHLETGEIFKPERSIPPC